MTISFERRLTLGGIVEGNIVISDCSSSDSLVLAVTT